MSLWTSQREDCDYSFCAEWDMRPVDPPREFTTEERLANLRVLAPFMSGREYSERLAEIQLAEMREAVARGG